MASVAKQQGNAGAADEFERVAKSGNALPLGRYRRFKSCRTHHNQPMKQQKQSNKMKNIVIIASIIATLSSCTENQRAKQFGGTATVDLPKGTKFVNATWKEDALWYAYRPARVGEMPETVTLREQSSFGLIEGEVRFNEH